MFAVGSPLQCKWSFQLSSYRRFVSVKYRDFLVEGMLPTLQVSLFQDLVAMSQSPDAEESILKITEVMRESTIMMRYSSTTDHGIWKTRRNILLEINQCNSLRALQQLLFLIDPTAAMDMAKQDLVWDGDVAVEGSVVAAVL